MSVKLPLSELIDIKQLQESLDRLYAIRQIPVTIMGVDGAVAAHSAGAEPVPKRSYSSQACLRKTLPHTRFTDRYNESKCTHGLQALIFPLLLDSEPLAYLVLNHVIISPNPETPGTLPATARNQLAVHISPEELEAIKGYYIEYAEMLAAMARARIQHTEALTRLEERDQLFQMVTDNMVDSLWLMDLNLRITYATPSVFSKRGFTLEEIQAMPLEKHMTEESYRKATELMVASLQNPAEFENRNYTVEMEYYRRDGSTFWSETHLRFIRGSDGEITGIIGVGRDITDRKNAEKEIKELSHVLESRVKERTAQLRAMNRDLESFSYSVAHDLKAPLRAMDGYSQILLDDYQGQLDDQAQHYLFRIREASQGMGQLIDGLLRLSHVSRLDLNLMEIDLMRIAREVLNELSSAAPGRKVNFVGPPRLMAEADPSLMRIALNNLITNAWKFTEKRPEARIEIGLQERAGKMAYYVKDNGVGFEMASAARLFQPFQRLHRQEDFDGNGIGLTIVHKIVDRHGGHIWAESRSGQGACFYFTLPRQGLIAKPSPAFSPLEEPVPTKLPFR